MKHALPIFSRCNSDADAQKLDGAFRLNTMRPCNGETVLLILWETINFS